MYLGRILVSSSCCIDFDRIASGAFRPCPPDSVPWWAVGTSILSNWFASEYFRSSSRYSFLAYRSWPCVIRMMSLTFSFTSSSWSFCSSSIYSTTRRRISTCYFLSSSSSSSSSYGSFSFYSPWFMCASKSSLLTYTSASHVLTIGNTLTKSVY